MGSFSLSAGDRRIPIFVTLYVPLFISGNGKSILGQQIKKELTVSLQGLRGTGSPSLISGSQCDDKFLPGLTGKRTELNLLANGSKRQSGELTLSTNSATGGQKSVTNFWIPGICGHWTSDKPRETSQDLLSLVFNVSQCRSSVNRNYSF